MVRRICEQELCWLLLKPGIRKTGWSRSGVAIRPAGKARLSLHPSLPEIRLRHGGPVRITSTRVVCPIEGVKPECMSPGRPGYVPRAHAALIYCAKSSVQAARPG